jgi:hypothetical protein
MKSTVEVLYIQRISEKIRRIRKKFGIRTTFRSQATLWSILMKTIPKNEIYKKKNCLYSIPCECGKKYIGETRRPLNTTISKHKCNIEIGEISKSKTGEHSWFEDCKQDQYETGSVSICQNNRTGHQSTKHRHKFHMAPSTVEQENWMISGPPQWSSG